MGFTKRFLLLSRLVADFGNTFPGAPRTFDRMGKPVRNVPKNGSVQLSFLASLGFCPCSLVWIVIRELWLTRIVLSELSGLTPHCQLLRLEVG